MSQNPTFHVFRSPDGAGDWVRANTDPISELEFRDTNFHFTVRGRIPHYRVLTVLPDGEQIHAHPVGLFQKLTKAEYGACHFITKQEFLHIRKDGIPVLHYIPRTTGEIADGWNEETGQQEKACEDPDRDGFGQKYVGGYREPLATFLRPADNGPIVRTHRDDGTGILDEYKMTCRMLHFPRPEQGHMILHPASDNRYIVTDVVKPYCFRGDYPVAYDVQLELDRRESPVYRVPVPDLTNQWRVL